MRLVAEEKFSTDHWLKSEEGYFCHPFREKAPCAEATKALNDRLGTGLRAAPIQFFDVLSILRTARSLMIARST